MLKNGCIECAKCKEYEGAVGQERPDFGENQVKDLSEIEKDKQYVVHLTYIGEEYAFVCLSEPFQTEDGNHRIKVRHLESGRETIESLAALGVMPYSISGVDSWNNYNWLEKI